MLQALGTYADTNMDFINALLAAYHQMRGHEIITYDRELVRYVKKG